MQSEDEVKTFSTDNTSSDSNSVPSFIQAQKPFVLLEKREIY